VGELLRNIPDVPPVASNGQNIYIGGLPVTGFGDIVRTSFDSLLRVDPALVQVGAIRSGSARTTASNAPGGIINFILKTGEREEA
jgi:outer membrane receptor protein involved in Fe transport